MEQEICPTCPREQELHYPIIYKILYFISLMDTGCPVGRHELKNEEWLMVGALKKERDIMAAEERENAKH